MIERLACCALAVLVGPSCAPPAADDGALDSEAQAAAVVPPPNPCTDPDRTGVKIAPPPSGVYHGVFLPDLPVTGRAIRAFEALSRRHVAWVYFDNPWGRDGRLDLRFPTESVRAIWNSGAVPFIRFMPWTTHTQYQQDPVVRLKELVDGSRFDEPLQQWLLAARATGIPMIVQFGVEVNGSWFPWNGYWNGQGETSWQDPESADGPEAYRRAYRKLVTIARKNGVRNITWAFHVSHWPEPGESQRWNQMRYYYPGDSYIDWIGVSVYGEMRPTGLPSEWHRFPRLLGQTNAELAGGLSPYEELVQLTASTTKPLAIFETAVAEDPAAGDKGAWVKEAYDVIVSGRFPRLKGVNWWQQRWDNEPPVLPSDMRIDSAPATLAAYQAAVGRSAYRSVPRFVCTSQALP
jgi:hypothetical protein